MALPILDGNQTAATLSTVLTSGEHIPAHTVVSLGSQAITDVRSAVSGSVVSISNFPASQSTTFGAVTGSVSVLNLPSTQTIAGTVTVGNFDFSATGQGGQFATKSVQVGFISDPNSDFYVAAGEDYPFPVNIRNPVTIASIPAISGTVTANGGNFASSTTGVPSHAIQLGFNETLYGYGFLAVNNDGNELPVRNSGAIEVGSLPAISGTVTIGAVNTSVTVSQIQGTSVTTSNFTSTTASTTLVSANSARLGLTVFNEGAGNLHICAGATATTVAYQVRLSAGDYWECPAIQTSLAHSAQFASAGTARVVEIL